MRYFIKQHKCLIIFAIISIAMIVLSLIFKCDKSPVLLLIVQIAIGYLINVIFYVTLSYLPTKRKTEMSYKIISQKIDRIVADMKDFPNAMIKQFPSNSPSRKEQIKQATYGFYSGLTLEYAGLCLCSSGEYKKWNAGNFLYTKARLVEDNMDFILKYYADSVLPELDEVFEKIRHTSVHTALKMLLECNRPYTNSSDSIVEYDNLADELEKVKNLYL